MNTTWQEAEIKGLRDLAKRQQLLVELMEQEVQVLRGFIKEGNLDQLRSIRAELLQKESPSNGGHLDPNS